MEAQLDAWGRQVGVKRIFTAQDRCTTTMPRRISAQVVLMKDAKGAGEYFNWLQEKNRIELKNLQTVDLGETAYQSWQDAGNSCADSLQERILTVEFLEKNMLFSVGITGTTEDAGMLAQAAQLADLILARMK